MRRLLALGLVVAAAAGTAGAASSPSAAVAQAKAEWLRAIRASALSGDRAKTFPSPPRTVLMQRLQRASSSYFFSIASVQMLHPVQLAPVIVIRSNNKRAIAKATPKIIKLFNPYRPTAKNPSGFAYEGYFFVAQTTNRVPYLATFNHMRAPHTGGGQWAASEDLYPFPHG